MHLIVDGTLQQDQIVLLQSSLSPAPLLIRPINAPLAHQDMQPDDSQAHSTMATAPSVTATLYSTGKYSDLTIVCQSRESKIHKSIVCMQSKVLAAAVDGNFKEATTGRIDLDDNEPHIVENMLSFLYTQSYDDGRGKKSRR